jgi:polyene glycosyltransferase
VSAPGSSPGTVGSRPGFKVLFVTPPSAGQANPLLAIAGEVSGREGATVWFSSAGNSHPDSGLIGNCKQIFWRPYTEDDVVLNKYHDPVSYRALRAGPLNPMAMRVIIDMVLSVDRARRDHERISAVIREIMPDIMVIDWMVAGAIDAAIAAGVRFVMSIPGLPSSVLWERLPPGFPSPGSGLHLTMSQAERKKNLEYRRSCFATYGEQLLQYRRMRETLGIGAKNYYEASKAEAILCYSLWGIEYPFPVPETLHMLGAIAPVSPDPSGESPAVEHWIGDQSSVVFVTFGTLARFTSAEIRELALAVNSLSDYSSVLWKVNRRDETLLARGEVTLRESVRVESWLSSQHAVMRHPNIRAVICHGGANTVHEALYYGKAALIVPLWLDCHDMAARLLDSGAGLATAGQIRSKEIVQGTARILLSHGFSASAAEISRLMRKAGGRERAADIICALASPFKA